MLSEEDNTQLVEDLQEAQKKNLQLREQIMNLKRELKIARSQTNSSSDIRTERDILIKEKETWMKTQIENQRLVEENARLSFMKDECERVKNERNALKEQVMILENRVNDTVMEKERVVMELKTHKMRMDDLERSLSESRQQMKNIKRAPNRNINASNLNIKLTYNNDVRNWHPQTDTPYLELLEFMDRQYDSFMITYKDVDNDQIRLTCDEDLVRCFAQARDYGSNSLKIQCVNKAEQELRRDLGSLELKLMKFKKQIKKMKHKEHGIKKGQALLDAIYMNRKKEDTLY
jgi:hypothetical protein